MDKQAVRDILAYRSDYNHYACTRTWYRFFDCTHTREITCSRNQACNFWLFTCEGIAQMPFTLRTFQVLPLPPLPPRDSNLLPLSTSLRRVHGSHAIRAHSFLLSRTCESCEQPSRRIRIVRRCLQTVYEPRANCALTCRLSEQNSTLKFHFNTDQPEHYYFSRWSICGVDSMHSWHSQQSMCCLLAAFRFNSMSFYRSFKTNRIYTRLESNYKLYKWKLV